MKKLGGFIIALTACGGHAAAPENPATAISVTPVTGAPPTILPASPSASEPKLEVMLRLGTLCVVADGHVYCDQLGNDGPLITAKNRADGDDDITTFDQGWSHSCITTRAGKVRCSGDNDRGQLGARIRADHSKELVDVVGVTHARRVVATRDAHVCALLDDGAVTCWGNNNVGQTGSDRSYAPGARELNAATIVPNIKAEQIALTFGMTCARLVGGKVSCWGDHERPHEMKGLTDVTDLGLAEGGGCVIANGGKVTCWGSTNRLAITHARKIVVGENSVCAITSEERLSCVRLGSSAPQVVEGLPPVIGAVSSYDTTCAWTRELDLYCFKQPSSDAPTLRRLR